jgi:hypothetical protein
MTVQILKCYSQLVLLNLYSTRGLISNLLDITVFVVKLLGLLRGTIPEQNGYSMSVPS